MASYRFCRSDDIPLLVRAYNDCYLPHFPGERALTAEELKRAVRDVDLWTSGCMVAVDGDRPIAVALAAKRSSEASIAAVGVRPDELRRGHARHLLTSLSAKLAILGPPRIVAEIALDRPAALALFESCGFRREVEYSDFLKPAARDAGRAPEWVAPVTLDELIEARALDLASPRSWERAPAVLVRRKEHLAGLAVATGERIEAYVLGENAAGEAAKTIVALGCADPTKCELWLGLLLRIFAGADDRPTRIAGVRPDEVSFDLLKSSGFVEVRRTAGYAACAVGA